MSLKNSAFPASEAFDLINEALNKDDGARKEAVNTKTIFAFRLKNAAGEEQTWHIDGKESGTVGSGPAPSGKKPDVTLILKDEDFGKLVQGKAKAQNLFMSGKLKITGAMMKATKMEPILNKISANNPKPKL